LDRLRAEGLPAYWLGERFGDLPLTGVSVAPVGGGAVLSYGTCDPPEDEGGCAPPVQLQIFRLCERHIDLTRQGPGRGPLPHRDLTLRGVPAAYVLADGRTELYTRRVTVVVDRSGSSAPPAADVVAGLRALNAAAGNVGPGDPLPPPRPGACGRDWS
jgi:hypothetical protein